MNTLSINVEFQGIRRLLKFSPESCTPLVQLMRQMIEQGGDAWSTTRIVAKALISETPELHQIMRQQWRDPLLFHILTDNADGDMRQVARELDIASAAPDQGSLGIARAMSGDPPRPLFIIGAGFSYDSMPLTQELEALVTGLLAGRGIDDPVNLLRQDWRSAWAQLSEDPVTFKNRFVGFSCETPPSTQHRVLGSAILNQTVAGVVSFNWDDHIERAAPGVPVVNSESQPISAPGLWKMHGDVNDPNGQWVWPHEPGRPLANICDYVLDEARNGRISHVVVIGYSESEAEITDRLLTPLAQVCPNWVRVRPDGQAGHDGHVAKTSRQFMGELDSFQTAIANGLL